MKPRYSASFSPFATSRRGLAIEPRSVDLVIKLMPFFKGAKGDKGDVGSIDTSDVVTAAEAQQDWANV